VAGVEADAEPWVATGCVRERGKLGDRSADRPACTSGVLHAEPEVVGRQLEELPKCGLHERDGFVESEAEVRAETVSGDVRVAGSSPTNVIRANTVSGDVDVSDVSGEVWAESVSGDVLLRAGTIGRVNAKTVSGEISATALLGDASRIEGTAVSGDVEFDFTGSAAGDYRLNSFSGDIDNCFGPQAANDDDRPPNGRQVRFREGTSTARVEATTHSGDIYVCRQ
jgi:hypothetical protein